jgi:hypothetical protein
VRRIIMFTAAGLLLLPWHSASGKDVVKKPKASETATCGDYGTSVHFEPTPSAAARKALKEEKLVFVLHVSGIFENSDFT